MQSSLQNVAFITPQFYFQFWCGFSAMVCQVFGIILLNNLEKVIYGDVKHLLLSSYFL